MQQLLRTCVCLLSKDMFQRSRPADPCLTEGSVFVFTFLKSLVDPIFKNGSCFSYFPLFFVCCLLIPDLVSEEHRLHPCVHLFLLVQF